jgi:threonine synthase
MGLPIEKFIAATNANDIVPKYLWTGLFEPKASVATISNAMDVGNPSNFARIQALYDSDLEKTKSEIIGKAYTDVETRNAMKTIYQETGYIMCPHTAVAYLGLKDYLKETGSEATGIFLSTAHPAKFIDIVEETIESKIEIPSKLATVLKKEKISILMSNNFTEF